MRFCECGRNHFDPVHQTMGEMLICSLCNGFILCDYCQGADLDSPFMSIACYDIAESFACWHHAWLGIARPSNAKSVN
ncbi:MAG TPA: hypothetical protein VNN17_03925 [Terriglobia bacterium]|nr:hypothetical protein [Terriglobia bacterium]